MQMSASCTSSLECGPMSPCCSERAALSPTSFSSSTRCEHRSQMSEFKVLSRPLPLPVVLVASSNMVESFGGRYYANSPKQSPKIPTGATGGRKSLAPLQLQSSAGQLLMMQMLQSQGQLVSTAARQLGLLAADRQVACTQRQHMNSGNENILYRRIAEIKAEETRRAVQEITYALVVERILETGVTMIATMASPLCNQNIASFPMQDKELQAVHAPQVQEMVKEHVAMVIGGKNASPHFDPNAVTQISKLRTGQIYAASVMYGYFLRRALERFRLDQLSFGFGQQPGSRRALQVVSDRGERDRSYVGSGERHAEAGRSEVQATVAERRHNLCSSGSEEDGAQSRSEFNAYIKSFDAETLQRIGKMRSAESVEVIERHVEALFGKPEMVEMGEDGIRHAKEAEKSEMRLKLGGVKSLVLEALAFGTLLWDVEAFVDSYYPLSLED